MKLRCILNLTFPFIAIFGLFAEVKGLESAVLDSPEVKTAAAIYPCEDIVRKLAVDEDGQFDFSNLSLRTARTTLRTLKFDDVPQLDGIIDSNVRFYFADTDAWPLINRGLKQASGGRGGDLGVFGSENGELIGLAHFSVSASDHEFSTFYRPTTWIGYAIGKSFRGHGYATEIAFGLRDFLVSGLNVPILRARLRVDNLASHRVLQKAGFAEDPESWDASNPQKKYMIYQPR